MKVAEKTKSEGKRNTYHKYYKCDRCGYISMVKGQDCPICIKDGFKLKLD